MEGKLKKAIGCYLKIGVALQSTIAWLVCRRSKFCPSIDEANFSNSTLLTTAGAGKSRQYFLRNNVVEKICSLMQVCVCVCVCVCV